MVYMRKEIEKKVKNIIDDDSNHVVLEGELIDNNFTVMIDKEETKVIPRDILGLFDIFNLGSEVKNIISPNKEYIVKIPQKLVKKIQQGKVDFLKDSLTGELLPILYDFSEKEIAGQVRLELRDSVSPQQWTHFGDSVSNIINQARFAELAHKLDQIEHTVKKIQQVQDSDRFAEIQDGFELIENAKICDSEVNKHALLMSGINKLSLGTNKVKGALNQELKDFPKVKNTKLSRIWFTIKKAENRENLIHSYTQIQSYFSEYLKGIKLLSEAYTYIGEPKLVENLINSTNEILYHKDIEYLNNIEKILPKGYDYSLNWYKNPKKIEQQIRDSYSIDSKVKQYEVKIEGKNLLDLLDKEE